MFRHIAVPLARPIIGLVGFFAFVASWNNFFLPFVMTYTDSQYSVQVGLQQLVSQGFAGQGSGQPVFAMAVIVTVLPVLIVFLFAQRLLVAGMLAGATTG